MRFLSFEIHKEHYGIQLEKIKEVIAFPALTPTPGSPPHYLGLMRLRSQVLSVIDLRIKLHLVPTLTHDTAVVVCESNGTQFGLVVDLINTVLTADDKDVIKPNATDDLTFGLISSVVRQDNSLILILDIDHLLNASDQELIKSQEKLGQIRKSVAA